MLNQFWIYTLQFKILKSLKYILRMYICIICTLIYTNIHYKNILISKSGRSALSEKGVIEHSGKGSMWFKDINSSRRRSEM